MGKSLSKLESSQTHVTTELKCQRDNLKDMQVSLKFGTKLLNLRNRQKHGY